MLSVRLFGQFAVQCDGQGVPGLEAHKVQELFSYLMVYRRRRHAREALAALLWAESSSAQSRKRLRQVLWQLQSALQVVPSSRSATVLLTEPDSIQVNSRADIWLDVAQFEQVVVTVQDAPGEMLDHCSAQGLRVAVDLYRGDLLEGWYQDWCLFERERLQNSYLTILDKLMTYSEAHAEYEAGLDYGTRILRCDPAHERTHQRLMHLHYLAGDRAEALRQYGACLTALTQELGVRPSRRTVNLYEQIRADRLDNPVSKPAPPTPTGVRSQTSSSSLHELCIHFRQVLSGLMELHEQMQEDLAAMERMLENRSD